MFHFSRTTLRELKKRYINVLKKCLLANLMAFMVSLPAMAETITNPATNEELLEALLDPSKRVEITENSKEYHLSAIEHLTLTYNGEPNVDENGSFLHGGNLYNVGNLDLSAIKKIDVISSIRDHKTDHSYSPGIFNDGKLILNSVNFIDNKAISESKNAHSVALKNNANGEIAFLDSVLFKNNQSIAKSVGSSAGVNNQGIINFKDVSFIGNKIITATNSFWGVGIYNHGSGTITISGKAYFKDNYGESGGGYAGGTILYNVAKESLIIFKGDAIFEDNSGKAKDWGRSNFMNDGEIIFEKSVTFKNNTFESEKSSFSAGISNGGNITFKSKAEFIGNKATAGTTSLGGALTNTGVILFENNVDFTNNETKNGENSRGGAIHNDNGKIIFYGSTNFTDNITKDATVANQGGSIWNTGSINFSTNSLSIFRNNSAIGTNASGGAIYNEGTLTFSGETLFSENKAGSSGALHNDGGSVIFEDKADFVSNQTTAGTAGALKNINNGKIVFKELARFENNYSQSSGGAIINTGSMTFEKGALFIGNINEGGEGGTVYSQGNLVFGGDVVFKNNIATHKGGMSAIRTAANTETTFKGNTVFEGNIGTSVLYNEGIVHIENDIYFINNTSRNGFSILESGSRDGEINLHKNFTFAANKFIGPNVGDIGIRQHNSLNILGKLGTVGTIEGGFSSPSWNSPGLINKSGTGLLVLGDQSENYEYKGKFNQTAGVTIANSERFFSYELARNTINGGELKTHGSEIAYKAVVGQNVDDTGAVLSAGKVMHYTTKPEMEVNATTLANITFAGEDMGATIGVGTYNKTEQEKEIALVGDRPIEYLDDKGTLDTADDEMVRYQATDKLFTIDTLASGERTMFKVTGALPNEKGNKIAFANGIVEIDESIGKTGAIYELDNSVLETTSVQNKVLSKNMILGEAQEYSFTELEVVDGTTLDMKNKKVSTDTLTMNDNAILNIDLNSVTDHGKMTIGEVQNAEKGKLSLKLTKGLGQENGIYQVFDKDNNLILQENKLFNIKDLENGAYEVSKKTSENLMKDFDMSASESAVAVALIESESAHKVFNQVQEEMLEALQSEDKAQVQKAKKALKAVGSKEHPVEQSVASEHLVALQNVVQSEMHTAGIGRAGGDTDPRAKVYIKGLYDRTKSSMGEGFRARSKGAVLGIQSEVTECLTLGVGYATSQTTAKEDLRRTEVDTNTGFISAHYQPNAWWLSGLATYSRGQYDEQKQVLSSVGTANYDVDSWGVQVMTGYDIKLTDAVITPEVGLRYLSVKQEGYTDTLGTTVEATSSDYLTAIVGVKGSWDLGKVRPSVGINVGYDVISDDVATLNTLANGASYTVNGDSLERFSTNVTLGLEAELNNRTSLKLEYSGMFRKEYSDHSGMLKFEWRF